VDIAPDLMYRPNGHNALALVREGCGTGYYGFAHQLGFIFGADLNDGNSNMNGGGEAYAHGYCGTNFRTVMAYNCPGATGGKRLPLWSNPDNTFNGNATGDASANNVKVLNDRALEVANFRFPVAAPTQPTLSNPAGGSINPEPAPTFTWTTQDPDRASSYLLAITDSAGTVHEHTYTPDEAGCAGAGTSCTVSFTDVTLPLGIVHWRVTAKNASGDTTSADGITTVTVEPILPGKVDLISPEGVITDSKPTYRWKADPKATWYQLWVGDSNPYVISQWYPAADVHCPTGTEECFVKPDAAIPDNAPNPPLAVRWWVRTWSQAGTGPWSESKAISVLP